MNKLCPKCLIWYAGNSIICPDCGEVLTRGDSDADELQARSRQYEQKYQMPSNQFYQRFQSGELGDSADFFEWSTYIEMLNQVNLAANTHQ